MDFRENTSIYLQIADWLCEQILLERYPVLERIPSVRELGVSLEVNPNTVMRSFDFLQNKDIITNKRGIGYFVSENAINQIISYKKERFVNEDIPHFVKNMQLLSISLGEFKTLYNNYLNQINHEKDK